MAPSEAAGPEHEASAKSTTNARCMSQPLRRLTRLNSGQLELDVRDDDLAVALQRDGVLLVRADGDELALVVEPQRADVRERALREEQLAGEVTGLHVFFLKHVDVAGAGRLREHDDDARGR